MRRNVSALEERQNPGSAAIVSIALFRARIQFCVDPGVSLRSTPGYHLTRLQRFEHLTRLQRFEYLTRLGALRATNVLLLAGQLLGADMAFQ